MLRKFRTCWFGNALSIKSFIVCAKDLINPYRFSIKFPWYTSFRCKENSPVTRGHINPHHLYIKFLWIYTALDVNEAPVNSRSANLSCIPNKTKSQKQTLKRTTNHWNCEPYFHGEIKIKWKRWRVFDQKLTWSNRIFEARIKK